MMGNSLVKSRALKLAWIFAEKFGLVFLSIFSFFIFSYLLTPFELGIAVLILAFAELTSMFFSSIIDNSLIARDNIAPRDDGNIFWCNLIVNIIIAIGLGFVISEVVFDRKYELYVFMAMTYLPLQALTRVHIIHLRREGKFESLATRTLLGKLVGLICGCGLAFWGYGIAGFIMQPIMMALVSAVLIMLSHHRTLPFCFDWVLIKSLVKVGLPAAIKSLSENFLEKGLIFTLSIFSGPAAVGFFNFANRLIQLPLKAITSAVMTYGHPVLSRRVNSGEEVNHFCFTVAQFALALIAPFFILLSVSGEVLVEIVFPEKWWPAGELISGLALLAACTFSYILLPSLLVAYQATSKALFAEVFSTIAAIAVAAIFTPSYGATGGVIAIAFKLSMMLPINIYVMAKTSSARVSQILSLALPLVVNVAMYIALTKILDSIEGSQIERLLFVLMTGAIGYSVLLTVLTKGALLSFTKLLKE